MLIAIQSRNRITTFIRYDAVILASLIEDRDGKSHWRFLMSDGVGHLSKKYASAEHARKALVKVIGANNLKSII